LAEAATLAALLKGPTRYRPDLHRERMKARRDFILSELARRGQVSEAEADLAVEKLGLPLIVKPPHEGSTLGLTKVTQADQMPAAYRLAARYDADVLIEECIIGRELTVPLLGGRRDARALPVVEIVAPGGNYDYEHKYVSNDTQYICPAQLDADLTARVMELSRQAYEVLACDGWGRADFMLDQQGRPWLLEMNTSPGMTSHSLVPMSAKADGMDYQALCLAILDTASCKVQSLAVQAGGEG